MIIRAFTLVTSIPIKSKVSSSNPSSRPSWMYRRAIFPPPTMTKSLYSLLIFLKRVSEFFKEERICFIRENNRSSYGHDNGFHQAEYTFDLFKHNTEKRITRLPYRLGSVLSSDRNRVVLVAAGSVAVTLGLLRYQLLQEHMCA